MLNVKELFSVEGKVVVITGGTGGIGSALVRGFKDAGSIVISMDKMEPLIRPRLDGFYKVDLSKPEKCAQAFRYFLEEFKQIDVLINCAGLTVPYDDLEYPTTMWQETLNNNLGCVWNLTRQVGLFMINKKIKGSIINITSINAAVAMPNNPAYAAAKAAIMQLTKALALDWGKYGIRVNNLGPGYTKTKMNKKSLGNHAAYQLRCDNSMLGRWAEPEEMVGPVIFLASNASSFVTGTDLWVDGGWLSKGM
jgi:NAD(P)-dependent dehydrogenase (short-subunit alcohol dehydrogenase family)